MNPQDIPHERLRRWTRTEVYRLLELGILNYDRAEYLELIDGQLVNKVRPLTPRHASITGKARRTLEATLPPGVTVRPACPLAIDDYNEPEPDILVVSGGIADYMSDHPHPADTQLLIETADDTLEFDRSVKADLYAQAGIADYWIVNLIDRSLEVHRDPMPDGHYQNVQAYDLAESVSPLAFPDAPIRVADLLPTLRV